MPEGDTIHKLAAFMAPLLNGTVLVRFELRGDPTLELAGQRVESVEARGKHLLIRLAGDLTVRTHLGMTGSWHRYAPGETWKRPARQASVVLANEEDVFVCFNAREAECMRTRGLRATAALGHLGPDLALETPPDLPALVTRARRLLAPETPAVDLLLHQGVACGIGNVYKSELLFLQRVHPLRSLESLDDATISGLYTRAHELLRKNLGGGPRITRECQDGAGTLWVYRRHRRPCHRCTTPIESAHLGRDRRVTFWCERCLANGARIKSSTTGFGIDRPRS